DESVLLECPAASTFTFQVARPSREPASGVHLHVEAGGKAGIRRAAGKVSELGKVELCIRHAVSGEMVDVSVAPPTFRVLYPPNGRSPVTREGSPQIVVCEAQRDCSVTQAQANTLVQKAQARTQSMSPDEKAAFFREWAEDARRLGRETNADVAPLLGALAHEEQRLTRSTHESQLLRRYVKQARTLIVQFELHAE